MIDRQLALLEADPPGGLRWLVPALVAAAAASGALLFASVGEPLFAGLFLAGVVAMLVAAFVLEKRSGQSDSVAPAVAVPDFALASAALNLTRDPAALSDASGRLLGTNAAYRSRFGEARPNALAGSAKAKESLQSLAAQAWRDGRAVGEVPLKSGRVPVSVERVGAASDVLLWRIARGQPDMLATLVKRVSGVEGELFSLSGVLAAAVDD
ncbi:MAG TPA: hypothetical protein VM326_05705, partial [Sphingomicrobium sp.]|nr:hypothetical protein [Sphingomicrobium sp.]